MRDLAKAIAAADVETLAKLVSEIPTDRLRGQLVGELRAVAIDRFFRQLPDYLDADLATGMHGLVGWEITGDAAEPDRCLLEVADGACHVQREPDGEPNVTIRLDAASLLRLATGNANAALLVLAGDLALDGDERLALRLVRALRLPTADGVTGLGDPRKVDAVAVARLVREVSERDLRRRLRGGIRQLLVEEIVERMPDYFDQESAAGVDAVIAWRITGGEDGDDRFLMHIAGGRCRVDADITEQPAVSLRMEPALFLKLVTGNANPMGSVLTGKLSVRGDLLLAARIPSMFTIPHG